MLGARWINLFCGEIDIALAMHSPRPPPGPVCSKPRTAHVPRQNNHPPDNAGNRQAWRQ